MEDNRTPTPPRPPAIEGVDVGEDEKWRASILFESDCSPATELRWWATAFGSEQQGMKRLVSAIFQELSKNLAAASEASFDTVDTKERIDLACSWLEHVICMQHLLHEAPIKSNASAGQSSWSDSALTCKIHIKSATDNEPQRVCSRSFRAGDIVWNCKQCQMDTTCVLCQECFRDSDHEGHDVYFYHVMTDAGGCCDCGDPGAWDPKGFCVRHGGSDSKTSNENDPARLLPAGVGWAAELVVSRLINWMSHGVQLGRSQLTVRLKQDVVENLGKIVDVDFKEEARAIYEAINFEAVRSLRLKYAREELNLPVLLKKWLVMLEDSAQQHLRDVANVSDPFVICLMTLENVAACKRLQKAGEGYRFFDIRCENEHALVSSFFIEHLATWLLRALCVESDAFTRITCRALTEQDQREGDEGGDFTCSDITLMPLKEMIVQDLLFSDSCSKALRNLYIRLLVDRLFKQRFAVSFAKVYRRCAAARVINIPAIDNPDSDNIFGLSVQFLNRSNHVLLMLHEHGFLSSILESLCGTLTACVQINTTTMQPQLDLFNSVLTQRKTKCLVIDFQYVLNAPGISRYALDPDQTYLSAWFEILGMVYGLHEQTRIVAPHNPTRDDRWVPAFNLSLSFLSLFADLTRYLMFGEVMEIDMEDDEFSNLTSQQRTRIEALAKSSSKHGTNDVAHCEWCTRLVEACAEHTAIVLDAKAPASVSLVQTKSVFGDHPYSPYDVMSLPVTFHCLLQRFFATVYSQSLASTLEMSEYEHIVTSNKGLASFWLTLIRQPLNAIIFFATSAAGMWNRNEDVCSQAMNYQSMPFMSGMFMDIRVLQTAALNLPGDTLVSYIVHAFDLTEWLNLGSKGGNGPNLLHSQHSSLEERDLAEGERKPVSATCASVDAASAATPTFDSGSDSDSQCEESSERTSQLNETLAASMLELLCVTATELPTPTPFAFKRLFGASSMSDPRLVAESEKILRREVIHIIAIKRSTFSIINDNCAHLKQLGVTVSAAGIRKILSDVAEEISRSDGMGPIQYELKPEAWNEFDPLFHRLARNEKDDARERWLQLRRATPLDKPSFPGDTKPKSAARRTEPLPAVTWYTNIHPAFQPVRDKLLLSDAAFTLVHKVLLKICKNDADLARRQQSAAARLAQTTSQGRLNRTDSAASIGVSAYMRDRTMSESSAFGASPATSTSISLSSSYNVTFIGNALHLLTLQLHHIRESTKDQRTDDADVSMTEPRGAQVVDGQDHEMKKERKPQVPGSLQWYTSKLLAKDAIHEESILDCLLLFWYNDPKIDVTSRENVRWLLSQLSQLDTRALTRIKRTYRAKKPALQAEKDKLFRKRKAQRHAMNSMRQSQEIAARAFAMEMEANGDIDMMDGSVADAESPARRELSASIGGALAIPPPVVLPRSGSDAGLSPATAASDTSQEQSDSPLSLVRHNSGASSRGHRRSGTASSFSGHSLSPSGTTPVVEVPHFSLDPQGKRQRTGGSDRNLLTSAAEHSNEEDELEENVGVINEAEALELYKEQESSGGPAPLWVKQAMVERRLWSGPECVSCHERHRLDDGPTCYIAYRQSNDVLIRSKAETTDKFRWSVYWAEQPGRNYTIQLCGHAIHTKCLEQYRTSIQQRHATNMIDVSKNEFHCPLCKKLSNFAIPCIPPSFVYGPALQAQEEVKVVDSSGLTGTKVLDESVQWLASFQSLPAKEIPIASPLTPSRSPQSVDRSGMAQPFRLPGGSDCISNATRTLTSFAGAAAAATMGESGMHDDEESSTPVAGVGALSIQIDEPNSAPKAPLQADSSGESPHDAAAFYSHQLEPLTNALRGMSGMEDAHNGTFPYSLPFTSNSQQGRLREMEMMLLLDLHRRTPRDGARRVDPIAIVFSVALTFIAEREAAYFSTQANKSAKGGAASAFTGVDRILPLGATTSHPPAGTLSTTTVKKMKRMFEACRALLLADGASGANVVKTELFEFFSSNRTSGFHSVLHHSPEMLLFLMVLGDLCLEKAKIAVRAVYVLCLVQALLDLTPEVIRTANAKASEAQGVTPVLEGAAQLRQVLLNRFVSHSADNGAQEPRVFGDKECGSLEQALIDSLSGYIHFAQILVAFLGDGFSSSSHGIFGHGGLVSPRSSEIRFMSRASLLGHMQNDLNLPTPTEILGHEPTMRLIGAWISQSLVCLPQWEPRGLSPPQIAVSGKSAASSDSSPCTAETGEGTSSSGSSNSVSGGDLARVRGLHSRKSSVSSIMSAGSSASLGEGGFEVDQPKERNAFGSVIARPSPCPAFARPLTIRPLVQLRHSYTEQYVEVHQGAGMGSNDRDSAGATVSGTSSNGRPVPLAICLICGQVLAAGKKPLSPDSIRNLEKGGCTTHMAEYHNGIGMVLLFRNTSNVLLINGVCSAYFGSVYADRNGDDQQQVIPSLPMFLDSLRYARVKKLWAENNIPNQVASLRTQTNQVLRPGFF